MMEKKAHVKGKKIMKKKRKTINFVRDIKHLGKVLNSSTEMEKCTGNAHVRRLIRLGQSFFQQP